MRLTVQVVHGVLGRRHGFVCLQAEDGIRDLVRSRGLGDVYKRQVQLGSPVAAVAPGAVHLADGRVARAPCVVVATEGLSLLHI